MLYNIGFFIFSIFYLPALLFKGKLHRDFLERFGVYDRNKREILASDREKIWIQAVSVGEVSLCRSLVPSLKERYPAREIILSTITKTGNILAQKAFSEDATIIYFPLDFSFVVRKVVDLIKPKLYVMIETEIWPNLLKGLSKRGVPSILINGRISDKAFDRYRLAKPFLRSILGYINCFAMQSESDARRIKALGAPPERVKITGNMKFDIDLQTKGRDSRDVRGSLGLKVDEELLVCGSTHKGEEEILIEVFKELAQEFPRLRLLVAPRHIERAADVERIVRRFCLEPVRVSQLSVVSCQFSASRILILDTIGQLNDIYSIATIVFIGGSLVAAGGHNPIEPAIFEKAILFGQDMSNFKNITAAFLKNEAAIQIFDKKELFGKCERLLRDEDQRARLGGNAKRTVLENCGATERNMEAISKIV